MAYNKTSEERKWNYWKEQEEKKLRELGIERNGASDTGVKCYNKVVTEVANKI